MALHSGFTTLGAPTALDTRLGEMSYVVRNSDGSPRLGVMWDLAMNAFLVTATAATNPMTVLIPAASFIVSRSTADGVVKLTNDGTVTVNVAAAPAAGQSRIDVIYVKQNDSTQGDANDLPIFGILAGTAATTGSQTKPSLSTLVPGALELATLLIAGGTTATTGATLTQTFPYTGFTGAIVPFRDLPSLKAWSAEGNSYARVINGTSVLYTYDASASAWHPVNNTVFAYNMGTGTAASGTTDTTIPATSTAAATNDSDLISIANNVLQVAIDGNYRLTGTVQWNSNATGVRSIRFTFNDAPLSLDVGDTRAATNGFVTLQTISCVIFVPAGTYIKLKGFQNSGASFNYSAGLAVELIR